MAILHNVPSITPGEISEIVCEAYMLKTPIMIWGEPGIGKSQTVSKSGELIKKRAGIDNFSILDRRMAQYDGVEVRGIPRIRTARQVLEDMRFAKKEQQSAGMSESFIDEHENDLMDKVMSSEIPREKMTHLIHEIMSGSAYAEWSRPDILPRPDIHGKHGILFLDELSNAPMEVQAASYQLILDRRLGDYLLPDGWSVVAAGNRSEDRSGVFEMSAALANRFAHFQVTTSLKDWLNWAYKNDICEEVIAYIQYSHGTKLFMFDPSRDDRVFATPRSWEAVSKIIQNISNENIRSSFIHARVGVATGSEFDAYCSLRSMLPDIDNLINNWKDGKKYQFPKSGESYNKEVSKSVFENGKSKIVSERISIDSLSLNYMVITGIAKRASEKTADTIWDIIGHLCDSKHHGHKEFGLMLCIDSIRKDRDAMRKNTALYFDFVKKNQDAVAF
jgi:MoxR-like ATPase